RGRGSRTCSSRTTGREPSGHLNTSALSAVRITLNTMPKLRNKAASGEGLANVQFDHRADGGLPRIQGKHALGRSAGECGASPETTLYGQPQRRCYSLA